MEYFTLTNDLWASLSTEFCLAVTCQFKIKNLKLEAVALWDVHMAVNSARVPFVNCKIKFCALYLTLLVTSKL